MNNLQLKFDNFQRNQQDFQKKFEQKQDDFQNQMMQFMQNLYNKPSTSSSSLPSNTIPNPKGEAKAITTRSEDLNDTKMVLELADRTISKPTGVAENVFVKVVIIAKDLSSNEKTALINVLKTRKKAIAWKLTDIKGIDLEFCSHKILLEEDYSPKVQSQRRVNPKIHDVIKKEVDKLLDAGLIYPISDSPWAGEFAASINLMPLSIWKKLRLPTLNDTKMVLDLADRTISKPTGVAENVFVKVGKFYFPADFVILDFVADPRVPLILG
nr:reverse transcriptase domain-containing protein [Tanacetum cinerariifolium]